MQDLDIFFKGVLLSSLSVSILGISWQLMKLISKMTETLDEFKNTNNKINKLLDQFTEDYKGISAVIKSLTSSLDKINKKLLQPIIGLGNVVKSISQFIQSFSAKILPFNVQDSEKDIVREY
ncbi:hypothetical protein GF362_02090 [Candidatus Dojkabacteria bacterium]|nr:hypothetical protein [Candidatus Dojkabacteria bacterium]